MTHPTSLGKWESSKGVVELQRAFDGRLQAIVESQLGNVVLGEDQIKIGIDGQVDHQKALGMLKAAPKQLVVFLHKSAQGLEVRILPELRAAADDEIEEMLKEADEDCENALFSISQSKTEVELASALADAESACRMYKTVLPQIDDSKGTEQKIIELEKVISQPSLSLLKVGLYIDKKSQQLLRKEILGLAFKASDPAGKIIQICNYFSNDEKCSHQSVFIKNSLHT